MSLPNPIVERLAAIPVPLKRGEPLARHTSFGLGGPAYLWVAPTALSHLSPVMKALAGSRWMALGSGTNVLFADEGFHGVVLCTRSLTGCTVEGERICAVAGTLLGDLISTAAQAGLSGLELLWGIPGTVGGAIAGNAGVKGAQILECVRQVTLVNEDGCTTTVASDQLPFEYRSGGIPARHLVREAEFVLTPSDPVRIHQSMKAARQARKTTQPWGHPSAGCVFRNPAGDSAGRLIDGAGLKGTRVGGAVVSPVHANFIILDGPARSAEVLDLVALIQARVLESAGVQLDPELVIVEAGQ